MRSLPAEKDKNNNFPVPIVYLGFPRTPIPYNQLSYNAIHVYHVFDLSLLVHWEQQQLS